MRKLIALTLITFTVACGTEPQFKEVKEQPVKDNTLDSLNAYRDSLLLDYDSFKKAQVDSLLKNL